MAAIAPSVFENNPPKAFPFKRLLDFKIQQKSKTNKKCKKNDGIDHNFNIELSIFNIKNYNISFV